MTNYHVIILQHIHMKIRGRGDKLSCDHLTRHTYANEEGADKLSFDHLTAHTYVNERGVNNQHVIILQHIHMQMRGGG